MRVEYGSDEKDGSADLDADWLGDGWVALLRRWLADAEDAGVAEPNAMLIGTVDESGRPVTRAVLCKSVDESGITFFTNYDSAKGQQLVATPGKRVHALPSVLDADVDVYAPCALGATLDHESVPRLSARLVCGAANNQLATSDVDEALQAHGVVWVPDYVANAGGVIQVGGEFLGCTADEVRRDVVRVGGTARLILTEALQQNIPTGVAAHALAHRRLERGGRPS